MNKRKFKETEIGMIPEDWEVKELEHVAVFKNGKSSPERDVIGKFPVYGSNGLIGFADEANSEENTIIIGRVGAYCGSVYYSKTKCWVTDNAIIGLAKINNSSHFLFYLLKKLDLNTQRGGSSQPLINQSILYSLKSAFPPTEREQKSIASILSSLDDKIELNQQMNKTLEKIGQAIFKHWFIDFEFPDEKGRAYKSSGGEMVDSELGEIPRGWGVASLGEFIELAYGKGLPEKQRKNGTYPVVGSNGIVGHHNQYYVEGPGIVIGRKGTIGEVIWIDNNFFPIDTTFYIVPKAKEIKLYYFYYLLQTQDFEKIGSDSAVPGLNRNFAYMNLIVKPPIHLVECFNDICQELFMAKNINSSQIATLCDIRDSLLPRLMSGRIRVGQ